MAWNGSGTYSRIHSWAADDAAGENIETSRMDAEDDSIATGINNCLTKDGQNTPTTNLPMGGNKHTGVADATARTDYTSAADVQDQHLTYFVDSGAADAYVITPAPSIAAYAEGQKLVFRATNANTGASTLNVNGLGAIAVQTNNGSALSGGEIVVGGYYEVIYDANGTRFVLVSPNSLASDSVIKYKVADETVTSSTTLQDDDHLAGFSMTNDKGYRGSAFLICGQNVGDIKFKLNFSNAPTEYLVRWTAVDLSANVVHGISGSAASTNAITAMTDAEAFALEISFAFTSNLTTGGTVDLQWAQNTSSANATTVNQSSWMEVQQIED